MIGSGDVSVEKSPGQSTATMESLPGTILDLLTNEKLKSRVAGVQLALLASSELLANSRAWRYEVMASRLWVRKSIFSLIRSRSVASVS